MEALFPGDFSHTVCLALHAANVDDRNTGSLARRWGCAIHGVDAWLSSPLQADLQHHDAGPSHVPFASPSLRTTVRSSLCVSQHTRTTNSCAKQMWIIIHAGLLHFTHHTSHSTSSSTILGCVVPLICVYVCEFTSLISESTSLFCVCTCDVCGRRPCSPSSAASPCCSRYSTKGARSSTH